MAAASDGGLGCVAGAGQEAAGRCARIASHAWPSAASGALAAVCWSVVSVEKWGWSMFAALCAVHGDVGAVVRSPPSSPAPDLRLTFKFSMNFADFTPHPEFLPRPATRPIRSASWGPGRIRANFTGNGHTAVHSWQAE